MFGESRLAHKGLKMGVSVNRSDDKGRTQTNLGRATLTSLPLTAIALDLHCSCDDSRLN